MYTDFKENLPNVNIRLSKFCALKPKWCVLAGSKMTHSVCVCSVHQNVVLLVDEWTGTWHTKTWSNWLCLALIISIKIYLKFVMFFEKYFGNLMNRLLHSMINQVMWYFWVFIMNPFSLLWSIFFSRNLCFLWSPCLLLITESVNLDTSGKPTAFFLENYFSLLYNIVILTWWT